MKSIGSWLIVLLFVSVFAGCKKGDNYDADKQLEVDEKVITDFLASKNITNAVRHSSGVYYIISNPGTGNITYQGNTKIRVNYTGKLLNGNVFDSNTSYEEFLGGLIVGWQIGIPLIQVGGKIRLLIPSVYAYGPSARTSIPANSVLDFEIELINVSF
jgi:FKBP-type peptidyl-prolyl cis-trans isomerase FkpA